MPAGSGWLSSGERDRLASFRFAGRRNEWLLGRWAAKQTLLASLGSSRGICVLSEVEVRSAPSGEPRVYVGDEELRIGLSLSHRAGAALCAVLEAGRVGCDLEWIEDRSPAFVEDYFGPAERTLIRGGDARHRALTANGLWSAKESVLKVLGVGLRVDTRSLEVTPSGPCRVHWEPFQVLHRTEKEVYDGWWRQLENWVLTVVTVPAGPAPQWIQGTEGEG